VVSPVAVVNGVKARRRACAAAAGRWDAGRLVWLARLAPGAGWRADGAPPTDAAAAAPAGLAAEETARAARAAGAAAAAAAAAFWAADGALQVRCRAPARKARLSRCTHTYVKCIHISLPSQATPSSQRRRASKCATPMPMQVELRAALRRAAAAAAAARERARAAAHAAPAAAAA